MSTRTGHSGKAAFRAAMRPARVCLMADSTEDSVSSSAVERNASNCSRSVVSCILFVSSVRVVSVAVL
jgi:hypothetical protein